MTAESSEAPCSPTRDVVAIFHASFHPTKGNVIDWSAKASDDISLENIEFSVLPSGLHLVSSDVVHFSTTDNLYKGVSVFHRFNTDEEGFRGARLECLGVLIAPAPSRRNNAWRHVDALRGLLQTLYSQDISRDDEAYWEPAQAYYEEYKGMEGPGDWCGWSHELSTSPPSLPTTTTSASSSSQHTNPTLHLPHLLRILGPSSITLYKYAIGRKRILIYTAPPVEAACILCHVAADMCFEAQLDAATNSQPYSADMPGSPVSTATTRSRLRGKQREPIDVLGMVTLMDIDRLRKLSSSSRSSRGWIACTTDKLFLERPAMYDLLIDLTQKEARPAFYASKPDAAAPGGMRLGSVRFSWSDVKLWNELERVLKRDGEHACCSSHSSSPQGDKNIVASAWTDIWRVYEDVCVVCASLWMGWRGTGEYGNARIRLEGPDDLTSVPMLQDPTTIPTTKMRSLGNGIEGKPGEDTITGRAKKRASVMSNRRRSESRSGSMALDREVASSSRLEQQQQQPQAPMYAERVARTESEEEAEAERRDRQMLTTLALLQTLHAHMMFHLSTLEGFLQPPSPPSIERSSSDTNLSSSTSPQQATRSKSSSTIPSTSSLAPTRRDTVITLSPKDILAFELGPLSSLDTRYLEWLAEEYASGGAGGGDPSSPYPDLSPECDGDRREVKVVFKRGWRDMASMVGVLMGLD